MSNPENLNNDNPLLVEEWTNKSLFGTELDSFQAVNQVEEPSNLTFGETVTGTLRANQSNKYSFTLESDTLLYFDSLNDDLVNKGYTWRILQGNNTIYDNRYFSRSSGFYVDNPVLNLSAGEYILSIDADADQFYFNEENTYSFSLSDLSQATVITLGETVSGEILKETDIYQIAAEAGDKFFFDVNTIEREGDYFTLIDPMGNVELKLPLIEALVEANYIFNQSGNYSILIESEYDEGDYYNYYEDTKGKELILNYAKSKPRKF